uniref:Uncharacterized protein n=1 Tax=Meloidogyne hapla TaxID=6305 RepID=A0A1I8BDN7_MELHA
MKKISFRDESQISECIEFKHSHHCIMPLTKASVELPPLNHRPPLYNAPDKSVSRAATIEPQATIV